MIHTITRTYNIDVDHVKGVDYPVGYTEHTNMLDACAELIHCGEEQGTVSLVVAEGAMEGDTGSVWWDDNPHHGASILSAYDYCGGEVG